MKLIAIFLFVTVCLLFEGRCQFLADESTKED